MRKVVCLTVSLVLILSLMVAPIATAADDIKVTINGQAQTYDQPPVLVNSRTLVPLRGIFEALGATITWEEKTSTVTAVKENTTVILKIGDAKASINGEEKTLDQPAELINGRTMVPVRFVSEAMGAGVTWEAATQTVVITTTGETKAAQAKPEDSKAEVPAASAGMALDADFEDGSLEGWVIEGNTTEVVDIGGRKALRLQRTEKEVSAHSNKNPVLTSFSRKLDTPLKGIVTIEFKMMSDSVDKKKAVIFFNSTSGTEESLSNIVRFQFAESTLILVRDPAENSIELANPIELNKWYHIKVIANTDTGKLDVYLDGTKKVDQLDFEHPAVDVAGIKGNIINKNSGNLFLDDLKFY